MESARSPTFLNLLPGTEPTYVKYCVIADVVERLSVKDKRRLFKLMRENVDVNVDAFFPAYGLTAGEFATWYVLSNGSRR